MKKWLLTPIIALLLSLSASCVVTTDDDSTLTIANDSDYVLVEIYVTDVGNPSWGPDLLGDTVLFPGESLTISLYCDTYDVQIVDQDGFICELYGLDLCFDDAIWVIDNFELATCGW